VKLDIIGQVCACTGNPLDAYGQQGINTNMPTCIQDIVYMCCINYTCTHVLTNLASYICMYVHVHGHVGGGGVM
jgi:hypothetical protein